MQFVGDTPYVLIILAPQATVIDLDEPGWAQRHAALMRLPGRWILARKDNTPVLMLSVVDGEQPSYTSRVVGSMLLPPPDAMNRSQAEMLSVRDQAQVRAYGIGKTRADGHAERMWVLPNGVVCVGDDVDTLGAEMARIKLLNLLRSEHHGPDQRRRQPGEEDLSR